MAEKEIDLLDLVLVFVRFIKRRILLFVISAIIGISVGYINYSLTEDTYTTDIYASSIDVNKQLLYEFLNPIKYDIIQEDYTGLSDKLNINSESARNLNGIELDTTNKNSLKFQLIVKDKDFVDSLAQGIVTYINNIDIVNRYLNSNKSNNEMLLSKINSELAKLEKTQDLFIKNLESNNNEILISQTANLNEQAIKLYEKKLKIENTIKAVSPVEIYSDMEYVFVPQNSLIKKIIFGILGFVFIGFIISLVLEINLIIKKKESN